MAITCSHICPIDYSAWSNSVYTAQNFARVHSDFTALMLSAQDALSDAKSDLMSNCSCALSFMFEVESSAKKSYNATVIVPRFGSDVYSATRFGFYSAMMRCNALLISVCRVFSMKGFKSVDIAVLR